MPIPELHLLKGFSCGFCTHLTISLVGLKEHGRLQHNKKKQDGVYWREVKLQSFFRGHQLRYFIVKDVDNIIPNSNPVLTEASIPPNPSVGSADLDVERQSDGAGIVRALGLGVPLDEAIDELADIPRSFVPGREGFGVDSVTDPEMSVALALNALDEYELCD
jgi:hypothetical protein